jgi:hypothetical protein
VHNPRTFGPINHLKQIIMTRIGTTVIAILIMTSAFAQQKEINNDVRVNLLFGINQPLLGGFNIEGNFFWKRLAFDYSHGTNLKFSSEILGGAYQEQGLKATLPWTTGFGVGYRFNTWLNLRVEPKWHKFEISYEETPEGISGAVTDYTTFTLGLGLYANLRPFKNSQNKFLSGLMIAPSIRYWPKVSSSLEGDQFSYNSAITGEMETIEALEVGISNTPWIVNLSIGYSFPIKKN